MTETANSGPMEELDVDLPLPSTEEMMQCQFSSWFDTFHHLESSDTSGGKQRTNVTIHSVILPLSNEFIDYLLSDGVRLPKGATRVSSYVPNEAHDDEDPWSSDEEEEPDKEDDDDDDSCHSLKQYGFSELNQQIQDAIDRLGGSVLPKLNWSSPKDATWINNGTLECRTPGDVYLLLKSSDFCMHDVQQLQQSQQIEEGGKDSVDIKAALKAELVLRKWCNLHPSMEFRCFVWNRQIVGISQRHHTQHFAHLLSDGPALEERLVTFYQDVIQPRFPLRNYCVDVYLDKKGRPWVLDFNVWGRQTDALLYTWPELVQLTLSLGSEECLLRVVETELEIHQDPLASYRAPIDTIDLAKNFDEFMSLCERPSERD